MEYIFGMKILFWSLTFWLQSEFLIDFKHKHSSTKEVEETDNTKAKPKKKVVKTTKPKKEESDDGEDKPFPDFLKHSSDEDEAPAKKEAPMTVSFLSSIISRLQKKKLNKHQKMKRKKLQRLRNQLLRKRRKHLNQNKKKWKKLTQLKVSPKIIKLM